MRGAVSATVAAILLLPAVGGAQDVATKRAVSPAEDAPKEPDLFLEPMDGFLVATPSSAYEIGLAKGLLGTGRPVCAMVVVPSWKPEWSVQINETAMGAFEVVSRRFTNDGLESLTQHIEETMDGERLMALSREKRIARVSRSPVERRALLDTATGQRVSDLCATVMLKTRYPRAARLGLDGTTYYFVHRRRGGSLSAKVWFPPANTLASLFVQMETSLASFAEADEASRAKAKTKLLEAVEQVSERLENPLPRP